MGSCAVDCADVGVSGVPPPGERRPTYTTDGHFRRRAAVDFKAPTMGFLCFCAMVWSAGARGGDARGSGRPARGTESL